MGKSLKKPDEKFQKRKAVGAVLSLNEILLDLIAATRTYEYFFLEAIFATGTENMSTGIWRMCFFHLVDALFKYVETYEYTKDIIPDSVRPLAKKLFKECEEKNIRSCRNNYGSHHRDLLMNSISPTNEIKSLIDSVIQGDQYSFIKWINNFEDVPDPSSVQSSIEKIRAEIVKVFELDGSVYEL